MKRWGDDEFVTRKIFGRPRKIDRDISIVKGGIEQEDMVAQVEIFVRLHGLLQHVFIVVAIEDAGFSLDVAVFDGRREQFHFVAQLGDFLVDAAILAGGMRKHSAVEFFCAKARLTPAEKENGSRAARNQLISKHAQHAGAHERIDILPANVSGFLLHDPEPFVAVGCTDAVLFERTKHVDFARKFRRAGLENASALDGNKIDHFGEVEMIESMEERPQICGDRTIGRDFVENVGLDFYELDDGIAAETAPIEDQRGIMDGRRGHGHGDLVPTGDDLAPMAQAHEFVHALDSFEFGFEPAVPVASRVFIETGLGDMAADAVVDLPGDKLWILPEGFSHGLDDAFGMVPIGFGVKADCTAGAFVAHQAAFIDRENLRMLFGEPDGRRSGRSGEHDLDAGFAEDIHYPAEPTEITFAFFRFANAPGEFTDTNDIDAGRSHHLRITFPGGLRISGGTAIRVNPLLRMVINTEIHRYAFRARRSPAM